MDRIQTPNKKSGYIFKLDNLFVRDRDIKRNEYVVYIVS